MTYVVSEIDSILILDEYRRIIYFEAFWDGENVSPITYSFDSDSYIEGIGHEFGFLWQYREFAEWEEFYLNAFSLNDSLVWGSDQFCEFNVSLSEFRKDLEIVLFPNPVENYLNIQYDSKIDSFELYDLHGKLYLQANAINQQIDLSELSQGVYIMKLYSDSEIVDCRRVVKI